MGAANLQSRNCSAGGAGSGRRLPEQRAGAQRGRRRPWPVSRWPTSPVARAPSHAHTHRHLARSSLGAPGRRPPTGGTGTSGEGGTSHVVAKAIGEGGPGTGQRWACEWKDWLHSSTTCRPASAAPPSVQTHSRNKLQRGPKLFATPTPRGRGGRWWSRLLGQSWLLWHFEGPSGWGICLPTCLSDTQIFI